MRSDIYIFLDQPIRMHSPSKRASQTVFRATGASNGSCSDKYFWLIYLEGRTTLPYCALHFLLFLSNMTAPSFKVFAVRLILNRMTLYEQVL